jgi:hypothetical protein
LKGRILSKVSDYLKSQERANAAETQQSVSAFAAELGREPAVLLEQLASAGISKPSEGSMLSLADKQKLLHYLQGLHGLQQKSAKRLSIQSREERLAKAVKSGENGAEYDALEFFVSQVFFGEAVQERFQDLVNLLLVKAVLRGGLPSQRLGRPKGDSGKGRAIAVAYFDLLDSGTRYEEAVAAVSARFHKSERQVMRDVQQNKLMIGETSEKRAIWRKLRNSRARSPTSQHNELLDSLVNARGPEFTQDELLEYVDELIDAHDSSYSRLTKKI